MGRKKIEMKLVKDTRTRQATFFKRKDGIFKKASDLAILTGAHVAIVAYSPTGQPFSFGSPSVDSITKRFLRQQRGSEPSDSGDPDEVEEDDGEMEASLSLLLLSKMEAKGDK